MSADETNRLREEASRHDEAREPDLKQCLSSLQQLCEQTPPLRDLRERGAIVTTPTRAAVKKYFASGPCLICGGPTYNAAHRKVDAIRDQYRAGGTFDAIACEFEVPVEIVRYIATAPIRKLDWLRRYRRKDAEARIKRELEGWEQ